jgi:hypothetical protein
MMAEEASPTSSCRPFQQADDEVLAGQDVADIVPIGDGAFFLIELKVVPQTIVIMFLWEISGAGGGQPLLS